MLLMSDQGLKMVQAAAMFGLLGMVGMPVWVGEKQDVMSEKERTARSTVPRSEFSDQPTSSTKEPLESVPGVSARQGANGRDIPLSIRGSK